MPDIVKEIFSRNLRYFMEVTGVSQTDISKALGVSSSTVSDWCNGNKYPRTDKIQQLADLLGVRFSALTQENGPADYEDQQRIEILHQNPKLRLLFDIQKKLTDSDLNAVLGVVNAIAKERGDDV